MEDGFHQIAQKEPRFATVLLRHGEPPSRKRPGGFETILKTIVQQQVSLASAAAIWQRLQKSVVRINADTLLTLNEEKLRGVGLSRAKAICALNLAEEVAKGRLIFRKLRHMEDEEVIASLTQIKGIGRWTAEVYLIGALQRPDIWPAADIALMEGIRDILSLDHRPSKKEMLLLARPWRPYRTFAARLTWLHYRRMTNRNAET